MNPQVGEIWRLRVPVATKYPQTHDLYFLLLASLAESIPTFKMLCLEDGKTMSLFMNFQLDDWEKHE